MTNNITKKIIIVLLILFAIVMVASYADDSPTKYGYLSSTVWENATIIDGDGNEKFNKISKYRYDVNNVGMTIMKDSNDVLRSNHGYCTDGNYNAVRGRDYWKLKIFSKQ